MNEEDIKIVMDQITSYDRFTSAVTVAGLDRTFAVVVVPPKAPILRRNGWQLMLLKESLILVFGSLIQTERPFVGALSVACATVMLMSSPAALYLLLFSQLFYPSSQLPSSSSAVCQ